MDQENDDGTPLEITEDNWNRPEQGNKKDGMGHGTGDPPGGSRPPNYLQATEAVRSRANLYGLVRLSRTNNRTPAEIAKAKIRSGHPVFSGSRPPSGQHQHR